MNDPHSSPIKTPKQLITVVVLAFVVPITLIILIAQLVTGHSKEGGQESSEAVQHRIKPVGEIKLAETNAPSTAAPTSAAAIAPKVVASAPAPIAKAAGADKGKSVFDSTCAACHGTGVAGAPKAGDKAAWEPRIKAGKAALYTSAIKGKNAMPSKGGNSSLSDDDVKAAVDYMVDIVK